MPPRKKLLELLVVLVVSVGNIVLIMTLTRSWLRREDSMDQKLAVLQIQLEFLEAQYREKQEIVLQLENKVNSQVSAAQPHTTNSAPVPTFSPEVQAVLRNMTGYRAAAGVHPASDPQLRAPFVYQLLPHLMNHPDSLKPAFHMKSARTIIDVVVGIPTVKRDKETYLFNTIYKLVQGLTTEEYMSTLIVVMIGETELEYVLNTAKQIELLFTKEIDAGLIEVISPSAAYYPDFDKLPDTLGDSHKRVVWRTKENLDAIYLMAYAKSKGTFYLMLEDDVISKKNYMQIKQFTATTTVSDPDWFFIEYCQVGSIGKLIKSSNLINLITYVQLFYNNMPIDWLLESYLGDKVCTIHKNSKECSVAKNKIRPKCKTPLFQHIGHYSSLKGKIHKIKNPKFGKVPKFYPHENPPVESIRSDIQEYSNNTLKRAYKGLTYFWGRKPKKGNQVEFRFEKPTIIERYTFRSGNAEHMFHKFYDTVVEVLPQNSNGNYTLVGKFDEFGLAEGMLKMGPLAAIRLRVNADSKFWVLLSEIELKAAVDLPTKISTKVYDKMDEI